MPSLNQSWIFRKIAEFPKQVRGGGGILLKIHLFSWIQSSLILERLRKLTKPPWTGSSASPPVYASMSPGGKTSFFSSHSEIGFNAYMNKMCFQIMEINSQSLEDTQVGYISHYTLWINTLWKNTLWKINFGVYTLGKYTLKKYPLEKFTLGYTL